VPAAVVNVYGAKAERVARVVSCVVGAVEREGGGALDEKPFIDQRTIVFSLAAFERIRSPWNSTLLLI
jgi:hypothetical protein